MPDAASTDVMVAYLDALSFLDWWLLGAILALADILILRGWLLTVAVAAGISGFVLMLFPQLSWSWQLLMFATVATAGLGWKWRQARKPNNRTDSTLKEEAP